MTSRLIQKMVARYPIVSEQIEARELSVLLTACEKALSHSGGDVVEFGCYVGTTSLFLARLLRAVAPERQLHVYDSFAGLPQKTSKDASPAGEQFQPGELHATKAQLVKYFRQAGLPLPIIHKAWFNDLQSDDIPRCVSFAFLDGDYYESIRASLRLVWPHIGKGGCIVVDDYTSEALPGARRAVDEWCAVSHLRVQPVASLAVLWRGDAD